MGSCPRSSETGATASSSPTASRFWPGDVLTCSAAVTGKREVAGEGLVDCEFSAVNQNGDIIIRGDATAALPR